MKGRIRFFLCLAIEGVTSPIFAQETNSLLAAQQVVVTGKLSDTAERRDFIAGKIIIGRKKIEESGLEHVADLLKREPAISVSNDGRIGLSGLPGYTQFLVDGAPPAPGKGMDQLNLVHVERIEIIKSAVAEFGPYGIAGTINVVTRKAVRKTSTQLSTGVTVTDRRGGTSATLSHNQSEPGSPLRLSTNLSVRQASNRVENSSTLTALAPGSGPQTIWRSNERGIDDSNSADLSAELSWDEGSGGDVISLSPGAGRYDFASDSIEDRDYEGAAGTRSTVASRTRLLMLIVPLRWTFKPDSNSEVEWRTRLARNELATSTLRSDTGGIETDNREQHNNKRSRTVSGALQYKSKLWAGHDTKLGLSVLRMREIGDYRNTINGAADPTLAFLGAQRQVSMLQTRVFVQDDWRVNDTLAFNLGLSGQTTNIAVVEGPFDSQSHFRVWSPSLHILKDLGGDDSRQIRVSVARTFRAPDNDQLGTRPSIHPRAPCSNSGICGANTIDTLDSAGNPGLQPERSLGLNLAYEHGLGSDSTLTIEAFTRRIAGKIGTDIALSNVAWASMPRYLTRPVNLGDARVDGLNVELELASRDLDRSWPKFNLRGSLNFANSRISSLPGPDNRLEKHTPWAAKLGASYSMGKWPVKFDLDAHWTPGVWVRSNLLQRIQIPRRASFDASSRWTLSPDTRLVCGISNLTPRTAHQTYEYQTTMNQLQLVTETVKHRTFFIRLETKL